MSAHDDQKPLNGSETAPVSAQPDDLHNLFEMPLNLDDEDPLAAIRDNPTYAELIKELEYIAAQARLLFEPAEEAPSDKVWDNIQKELGTRPTTEE